jgi:hypothetical protein
VTTGRRDRRRAFLPDSEAGKKLDETADGEQQKMGSEEKKAKIKSGEQPP